VSSFVVLPLLLKRSIAFPAALLVSVVLTVAYYLTTEAILKRFGVSI